MPAKPDRPPSPCLYNTRSHLCRISLYILADAFDTLRLGEARNLSLSHTRPWRRAGARKTTQMAISHPAMSIPRVAGVCGLCNVGYESPKSSREGSGMKSKLILNASTSNKDVCRTVLEILEVRGYGKYVAICALAESVLFAKTTRLVAEHEPHPF